MQVAVVSGKKQLLDRELLRMAGIEAEAMKIVAVKSSNHFCADFTPIASHIIVPRRRGRWRPTRRICCLGRIWGPGFTRP